MTATAEREPTRGGGRLGLIPRPVVAVISVLVIIVWALSQVAIMFVEGYQAPPEIHLAVMLVLSALFAVRKDDEKKPEKPVEPPQAPPPAVEVEPPPGGVSAAELIARLQAERRGAPPRQPPER